MHSSIIETCCALSLEEIYQMVAPTQPEFVPVLHRPACSQNG